METKTEEPEINWTADFTISEPLHDAASAISGAYTRMAINFPANPPDKILDELAIVWHTYYKQIGKLKFNSCEEGEEEINIIAEICKDVLKREQELIINNNLQAIKNLTESQLLNIYNEKIKPIYFNDVTISENKTVVFVGGQPGSGKSHLNYLTIAALDNPYAVIIDSNLLRENHPYSRLSDGMEIYELDEQCSVWGEMLLKEAMNEEKNIVFNGKRDAGERRSTARFYLFIRCPSLFFDIMKNLQVCVELRIFFPYFFFIGQCQIKG